MIGNEWVLLQLECMEIDSVIQKDEPPAPIETSTQMRLPYMGAIWSPKHESTNSRGSILECSNVKELLKAIDKQFM